MTMSGGFPLKVLKRSFEWGPRPPMLLLSENTTTFQPTPNRACPRGDFIKERIAKFSEENFTLAIYCCSSII